MTIAILFVTFCVVPFMVGACLVATFEEPLVVIPECPSDRMMPQVEWFCWAEHGADLFYVPAIPAGPEEIAAVFHLFFSDVEAEVDWALRNQNGVPLDSWALLVGDLDAFGCELSGLSYNTRGENVLGFIDSPELHPVSLPMYEEFAVAPTAAAIPVRDPGESFIDGMVDMLLSAYDTDFLECGSDESTFFYCEEVAC